MSAPECSDEPEFPKENPFVCKTGPLLSGTSGLGGSTSNSILTHLISRPVKSKKHVCKGRYLRARSWFEKEEQSGSADDSSTTGSPDSPVDIWDADQSDNDSEAAWSSGDPYEDWDIPAADLTPSPWEEMYHAQAARANSDPRKVLGIRISSLHNACNDAVAELLAFLRILKMTEDEYTAWMADGHLNPVVLDIFNRNAHKANRQMEKDMQWRREQSALRRKGNGKAKAKRAAP
ncbi:hypothetical protein V8F06_011578 [Rhypophila decipiens]